MEKGAAAHLYLLVIIYLEAVKKVMSLFMERGMLEDSSPMPYNYLKSISMWLILMIV